MSKQRRILIVEDDGHIADLMRMHLLNQVWGYQHEGKNWQCDGSDFGKH